MKSTVLIATALVLAACSAPPDVIVTQASERAGVPLATDGSAPPSPATADPSTAVLVEPGAVDPGDLHPGAVDPGDLRSLLLTGSDLPGWNVASPMTVPGEPTFEATDCPLMNDVWSVAARPGERVRGDADPIGVRFRNTAVVVDDADEAGRLLAAVSTVWETCPGFSETNGTWWSEPIDVPGTRPSEWSSAAIVLGNADQPGGWTIAMWQRESTIVVLEVEGDDMWSSAEFMFDVMSAHLDGRTIPRIADEWSDIAELHEPSGETAAEMPSPPTTLQVAEVEPAPAPTTGTTTSSETPGEFPPPAEEWTEHHLAVLAPHPADLGAGWIYAYGSLTEAAPSDPSDEFPGCAGTAPPTMDGLDITYRRERPDDVTSWDLADEIQVTLGSGDVAAASDTLQAIRAVLDCQDAISALGAEVAVTTTAVDMTADDALVLTYRIGESYGLNVELLSTIAVGRYGDLLIAAVWLTAEESGDELPNAQDHADRAAALVEQIARSR